MAKIFKGDVNFGFVINQTGAQPLDSRSVVQSYAELLKADTFGTAIYNGMTVATVDEQKVYMLVDKTKATTDEGWKEVGAGGALSVDTYAEAVDLATDDNIGQVIYVKTKSSYDADGDGEGAAIEYDAAPYIVIGEGSLQKLAASTASGDIEGDVAELTTKVSGLETDVADLQTAVNALPDTFVTDVKVGETSLVANGVANLSNFVQKDGDKVLSTNDYTTDEKNKLAGIDEGAEVNYVKSVGDNLAVDATGKLTVSIPDVNVPFQSVATNDKVLTLTDGVLSSTLSYAREDVEGVDSLVLKGIGGNVIGSVPVADFVADGMLESVTPVEGTNKFLFTFKTGNDTTESFEVDFSKFVDVYKGDDATIVLDSATNTFSVRANVFDAYGSASEVQSALDTYISNNDAALALKANAVDVYSKTDADSTFVKSDGYVEYTQDEKTKLGDIAVGAEVNVVKSVDTTGVLGLDESGKLSADLSAYALSADVYTKDAADDKFVALENYVAYTQDEKTKLGDIAVGAQVNVLEGVKVNDTELTIDANKKVNIDLSAYATTSNVETTLTSYAKSTDVESALALKADASALDLYIAKSAISGIAGEGGTITGVSESLAFTEDGVLEVNTMSSTDIMNVINA